MKALFVSEESQAALQTFILRLKESVGSNLQQL